MSKKDIIFIDRFSAGLDDLSRKDQGDDRAVIEVLRRTKQFSGFEASDNPTIASTMTRLCKNRLTTDPNSCYPWVNITHIDGEAI